MALPIKNIEVGEVRVDKADLLLYKWSGTAWVLVGAGTPSSANFANGDFVGQLKEHVPTGRQYKWTGSAWSLVPIQDADQNQIVDTATNALKVGGVAVTGTPTTGQVIKAISPTAAAWAADEAGGAAGLSVTTVVTSAQLIGLNALPVTLVPSPGVGKTLLISSVRYDMVYKGISYSGSGFLYVSFADNLPMMQSMVNGANFLMKKDDCFYVSGLTSAMSLFENKALVLNTLGGGGPTLGNSDITVTVNYTVVEIAATPAIVSSINLQNSIPALAEPAPSIPSDLLFSSATLYTVIIGGIRTGSSFALRYDGIVQDNSGVFKGATGIVVTSREGGIISTPTITTTGYLSFNYTTPIVAVLDHIDIVCVDEYGRVISKSLAIDVAF